MSRRSHSSAGGAAGAAGHRYAARVAAFYSVGMLAEELRCHFGREHYRILYRRSGRLLVLLHAFRKTTGKIPPAEIEVARERFDDFRERMDAQRRRPPRAAGRDAP